MFGEPKIKVVIINELGEKTKKYPVEGDNIVIRAARRGRGGAAYMASFDKSCSVPYYVGFWPFKRLKQKLYLIEGGSKCVSFDFTTKKAKMPTWTRQELARASEATVIKAAGATFQKLKIPALLYVALFASIGVQILTMLVVTGKVRI